MNKILKYLGLLTLAVGLTFLRLHVITKLWGYIAVPQGIPPMDMWTAFSLSFLISFIAADYKKSPKQTLEESTQHVIRYGIGILVTWGLGYLLFG